MEFRKRLQTGAQLPYRLFRTLWASPTGPAYRRLMLGRTLAVVVLAVPLLLVSQPDGGRREHQRVVVKDRVDAGAGEQAALEAAEANDDERYVGVLGWVSWVVGVLLPLQWLVVALSREFDDPLIGALSDAMGVAPEPDPPRVPRVRFEPKWAWKRIKRRVHVALASAPGFGLIGLMAGALDETALALSTVLTALWSFYWLLVGTAARSASAWEREGVSEAPAFLQGVLWFTSRTRITRWVGNLWARLVRRFYSPAEAVERHPAEFVGLGLTRLLAAVPLVGLFMRPLVPVAVAVILAPRAEQLEAPVDSHPKEGTRA